MVSTTIASVMELLGKLRDPETFKFVEVTEVPEAEAKESRLLKLVLVVKEMAPLANCISGVPVTELPFK